MLSSLSTMFPYLTGKILLKQCAQQINQSFSTNKQFATVKQWINTN